MEPEHLIYFVILALLAEILGTVGGFGSSLFFVPIAGFFFDFHSVLGITALFHVSSNISKIALFRKGFDKKLVITIGIPAVLFVILGAFLSRYVNSNLLEIALSVFLLGLSVVFMIFKNLKLKPTLFNSIGGGALSGITAGLLGTGGAIRGLALAAFSLEKDVFIATSAIIDLGIDFSRSVVYFSNGYMHRHDVYL
ncbi:MAG: sulfite exporter TauE/SafE family protein, partial [Bacteroidia bacterium]|nr:sulfite exporter TauE/SafE family protein [Bacteroidia bacterium]